jgi:UDP-hydrolysing UDP-N-acetyl-D-glucosamine 2-epimerase
MKRKICVITSSRADYGSLKCLMEAVRSDRDLDLQIIATGMHMMPAFGSTYRVIEKDRFKIQKKIRLRGSSETKEGMAKAIGSGCAAFADAYQELKPDWVVLFGDRFELYAAAIPASLGGLAIAHISGGEITEGAVDETVRHAVTKMAHLHFPAAEEYRQRIIQMGEQPDHVFNFGHLGLDNLLHLKLLDRSELAEALGFPLNATMALVTLHPETLATLSAKVQVDHLLRALQSLDLKCVFTKANCDTNGILINDTIEALCRQHPDRYKVFDSLGQLRYLSCLKHFDLMVGNSSSGMFEAPSFRIPVVNIGDRQKGRLRAKNIIDVDYSKESIVQGMKRALRLRAKGQLKQVVNPYRLRTSVNVAQEITRILKAFPVSNDLLRKKFFDLPHIASMIRPQRMGWPRGRRGQLTRNGS